MKLIFCLVFFLSGVCNAQTQTVTTEAQLRPSDLTASWHAVGKPFAKLSGIDTNDVKVTYTSLQTPGEIEGTFRLKLDDMRTGNDTRDGHMRGYLDTAHYPEAVIVLNHVKHGPDNFPWTGTLAMKGMTKPVHGTATVKGRDVWAQFTVSLADFGIKPTFAGVGIEDDITVTVKGSY